MLEKIDDEKELLGNGFYYHPNYPDVHESTCDACNGTNLLCD